MGSSSENNSPSPPATTVTSLSPPITMTGTTSKYHDPLPLHPLTPIVAAQRVRCRVRSRSGELSSTRRVLQGGSSNRSYAIDSVITTQPKTGITILLATPVIEESSSSVPSAAAAPSTSSSLSLPPLCPSQPPAPAAASCPTISPPPSSFAARCMVSCGSSVVIKAVPQPSMTKKRTHVDNPLCEIAAMQHLMQHHPTHPCVIPLLDCMQDHEYVYLVLPYMSGGDLFNRVEAAGDKGLPESEAASYLRQICEGLLFMKRTSGLAHHDVSLENVMLDSNDHDSVKVIDMGMCLRAPKVVTGEEPIYLTKQPCRGKPGYVAPEVVRQEACDPFASDIWSLGICLYSMVTGRPLYNSPEDVAFKAMARGKTREVVEMYEGYGLHINACAKDLVCRMLHADPTQRPTLEEVLTHPFVTQRGGGGDQQQQQPSWSLEECYGQ